MAHLLFLPMRAAPSFFLWDAFKAPQPASLVRALVAAGEPARNKVVGERLRATPVDGWAIAILDAIPVLSALPCSEIERLPASFGVWSMAAKLALELAVRGRFRPDVREGTGEERRLEVRWQVSLAAPRDAERVAALVRAMPLAAHAIPAPGTPATAERAAAGRAADGHAAARRTAAGPTPAGGTAAGRTTAKYVADASAPKPAGTPSERGAVWAPDALLRAFLDAAVDSIVRDAVSMHVRQPMPGGTVASTGTGAQRRSTSKASGRRAGRPGVSFIGTSSDWVGGTPPAPWELRFVFALVSSDGALDLAGVAEKPLARELSSWAHSADIAEPDAPRLCLRLEALGGDHARADAELSEGARAFVLHYALQAPGDAKVIVPACELWADPEGVAARLGASLRDPETCLLRALALAAQVFEPIGRSLREASLSAQNLIAREASIFLERAAGALRDAGFVVVVPADLAPGGAGRLRLRMRIGVSAARDPVGAAAIPHAEDVGAVATARGTGIELDVGEAGAGAGARASGEPANRLRSIDRHGALRFRWEAVLGDRVVSSADVTRIADRGTTLVWWRGQWICAPAEETARIEQLLAQGGGLLPLRTALRAALTGGIAWPGVSHSIEVVAEGSLVFVIEALCGSRDERGSNVATALPLALQGTLMPYQERGFAWLARMAALGLGGCLADDRGLHKKAQIIALLVHLRDVHAAADARSPERVRPSLIVCPFAAVRDWERAIERFAPSLSTARHGNSRDARAAAGRESVGRGLVVLTTYSLLRRDADVLAQVEWSTLIFDEVRPAEAASSGLLASARGLPAEHRFALVDASAAIRPTGLGPILELTNPGLLESVEAFEREVAVPAELYRDPRAQERLERLVGPFLLRRTWSDPLLVRERTTLPPLGEQKIACALTPERARLYEATARDGMRALERARGSRKCGLVVRLVKALLSICGDPIPAHGEPASLVAHSGKLARLCEILDDVLAAGERALIYAPRPRTGAWIATLLRKRFGDSVVLSRAGASTTASGSASGSFKHEDPGVPGLLVVPSSMARANLTRESTAAEHVFHFDRVWERAVERTKASAGGRDGERSAEHPRLHPSKDHGCGSGGTVRPVSEARVYTLFTAGTLEEHMLDRFDAEPVLNTGAFGAMERWLVGLDEESLRAIVSLSPNALIASEDTIAGEENGRAVSSEKRGPASAPSVEDCMLGGGTNNDEAHSRRRKPPPASGSGMEPRSLEEAGR